MRGRLAVLAIGIATMLFAFFIVHAHARNDGPVYRDFESYYAGGATWRFGGDPYSREVWRTERTIPDVVTTRDELLPFVGPPFGLPFWAVLSRLPWPAASVVWGTMLTISLAVLVFSALLIGGAKPAFSREFIVRFLAVSLFAASFAPVTSGVSLGQVAIVACAAIALAPFLLRGRRTIAKTFAAALVAGLQPNIAIALVARVANARSAVAVLGAGAIAICGSALALAHYGGIAHYAQVLAEHSAAERAIAIQTTVGAVARGLGASPAIAAASALAIALITLAAIAFPCFSRRYTPDDRLLLASVALPLLWPFAHEHDFAIVFVPALVVIMRASGRTWYLASVAALIVGADWLGLAQRPTGVSFEALRTCAGALALAALVPRARFSLRTVAPIGVAAVVLAIGSVAAAHPLSVWPDDLPRDFHVPLAFDAAQTWGAEQVRAGVAQFTQTNAALRALSLFGCALLWVAASIALRSEARQKTTER